MFAENQFNVPGVVVSMGETNFLTRWSCHVCGGHTEKVSILCEVQDGDYKGFRVCERCIELGGIDEKLLRRAEELGDQASALRNLVGRLRVPSVESYRDATIAHEVDCMKEYGCTLPDELLDDLVRYQHQPSRDAAYRYLQTHHGMTVEQIEAVQQESRADAAAALEEIAANPNRTELDIPF